jgi:hypothetical protein
MPEFSLQGAYASVDRYGRGWVDRDDFIAFIRANGLIV